MKRLLCISFICIFAATAAVTAFAATDGNSPQENNTAHTRPYTTIYVSGLSLDYTMKLKNAGTGKVCTLDLSRKNGWSAVFDGPEGNYLISGLYTGSTSGRAGRLYFPDGNEAESLEIRRTEGWQQINLTATEHVTFSFMKILKQHPFLPSVLAVLSVIYLYLRRHRLLPSEER